MAAYSDDPDGQTRAPPRILGATTTSSLPAMPSGKNYAVVIGINTYEDTRVGNLTGARRDAEAVAKVLNAQGFEVTTLLDGEAYKQAVDATFQETLYPKLNPEDRLLVYFAGHGTTVKDRSGQDKGYLIPSDGDSKNPFNMISMDMLVTQTFNHLPAHQILYIADACHAGLIQETRNSGPDNLVRVVMTAGTGAQEVKDNYKGNGLYTHFFLKGIQGAADLPPQDGKITSTELHAYIKGQVEPIAQGSQTATLSQIGASDFVFHLPATGVQRNPQIQVQSDTLASTLKKSYFGDVVIRHGALHGILPLTDTMREGRSVVYQVESKNGRVQTVTRLNGSGYPAPNEDGISQWSHIYRDGGSGDIAKLVEKNRLGGVVRQLHYSEQGATRVDYHDRFGKLARTWTDIDSSGPTQEQSGKDVFGKGYSYDLNGFIEKEWYLSYDPLNQVRRRGDDGTYGWRYVRNEHGQVSKKYPLDKQGNDSLVNGIASIHYTYNGQGHLRDESYWDNGMIPQLNENGTHRIASRFDIHGNKIEESYFDADGAPTLHKDGYAGWTSKFDARGNKIEVASFGVDGKPATIKQGYASVALKYDARGNAIEVAYFGVDGKPTLHRDGNAVWKRVFDDQGNRVEFAYLGIDGKPTLHKSGFSRGTVKFDSQGNEIERAYFGVDGKPTTIKQGYASASFKYDARGNKIEVAYFGVDGAPTLNKDGYAVWTSKFDARGNEIEVAYFGVDGKPTLHRDGNAGLRRKFDARGNRIEVAYFGVDGKPTLHKDGYAGLQRKFDARGNHIEAAYFGTDGKPTLHKDGNAGLRRKFDARGNKIEVAYFGVDGKPTTIKQGYASASFKYDARGNMTGFAIFNTDNAPAAFKDGTHSVKVIRGPTGKVIRRTKFDIDGNELPSQ